MDVFQEIARTIYKFISTLSVFLGFLMMLCAHRASTQSKSRALTFLFMISMVVFVVAVEISASFEELRHVTSNFYVFLIFAIGSFVFVRSRERH